MTKIRAKAKNSEEHCAVCRDGPQGLVMCRGCSTLIHAVCLIDVRGCPTIGCNESDPLQRKPAPAPAPTPAPEPVRKIDRWGFEKTKNILRAAQPTPAEERAFEAKHRAALYEAQTPAPLALNWDAIRHEDDVVGRKEVDEECYHLFSGRDQVCDYCGLSAVEYWDRASKEAAHTLTAEEWNQKGLRDAKERLRQKRRAERRSPLWIFLHHFGYALCFVVVLIYIIQSVGLS